MSEKEIRKEINELTKEIGALRKELRLKIDLLKEKIKKGIKFVAISTITIIGIRYASKFLRFAVRIIWGNKKVFLLSIPPAIYIIYKKIGQSS